MVVLEHSVGNHKPYRTVLHAIMNFPYLRELILAEPDGEVFLVKVFPKVRDGFLPDVFVGINAFELIQTAGWEKEGREKEVEKSESKSSLIVD